MDPLIGVLLSLFSLGVAAVPAANQPGRTLQARASDSCQKIPFKVGKVLEDSPSGITVMVSTDITNFVPARLVCLGRTLKAKYRNRAVIAALIFSSHESAARFTVPGVESDSGRWTPDLRGGYYHDGATGEDYVTLHPWGIFGVTPYDTKLGLAGAIPDCKLPIAGACLYAMTRLDYPVPSVPRDPAEMRSARLTLTALFARDGRVRGVNVGTIDGPVEFRTKFVAAATENLKSWRLDTQPNPSTLTVTYDFAIDTSLKSGEQVLEFAFPEIRVRGNFR